VEFRSLSRELASKSLRIVEEPSAKMDPAEVLPTATLISATHVAALLKGQAANRA
jgi:hypothetical protein